MTVVGHRKGSGISENLACEEWVCGLGALVGGVQCRLVQASASGVCECTFGGACQFAWQAEERH